MSNLHVLAGAQVILLAAQFISEVDVESLQILASERKDVLTRDIIYRLLLTLYPTDDTARSALLALLKSVHNDYADVSALDHRVDTNAVSNLSPPSISKRAEQLRLRDIARRDGDNLEDSFEEFAISWILRLESTEGTVEHAFSLVDAFASEYPGLERWSQSYLIPVIRLQYYFYPDVQKVIGVQELEAMSGLAGVRALLQYAEPLSIKAEIARDLDEVVAPWIQGANKRKRQRLEVDSPYTTNTSWSDVNEWILSIGMKDFELAAKTVLEWRGPRPQHLDGKDDQESLTQADFAQVGLAIVYANTANADDTVRISKLILQRVATLMDLNMPDLSSSEADIGSGAALLKNFSEADLLVNSLLRTRNELTRVSANSVAFLAGVLQTAEVLHQYKIFPSIADISRTCLSGSEERQRQELLRILQQIPKMTSVALNWRSIRHQLLWLRSWRPSGQATQEKSPPTRSYLAHVAIEYMETEILDSILIGGQYKEAKELYIDSQPCSLSLSQVESRIVAAVYSAYDNASNGNRTRGGMKRAFEILKAFQPSFPRSEKFRDIDYLIKATHSLSFYQLTLQYGVPFQPVNIRALRNPLSLVGNVLEQNAKAYTKLDDLLEIGRSLVMARLWNTSSEFEESNPIHSRISDAEHRITYLAITSALDSHDFDTAYSYITTRLSMSPTHTSPEDYVDDTSWRAAYAAGKYRPNSSPKSLHSRIANLSQRMDLLSMALTLTPTTEPLSEILGTWRRCEEEMENLRAQALDEERAFELQSDGTIPGGFGLESREMDEAETKQALARRALAGSAATYEEEAPIGLFDVSKAAVNALRRSAFPLHGASVKDLKIRNAPSRQSSFMSGTASDPVTDDVSRVRKRDMVSNMVSGGLGWVLGAQPTARGDEDENERS